MTGVEEIGYLDDLIPKPKPLLLKEIGNIYFNRKIKPLRKSERDDSVRWWKQFCKIIDANNARDISLNHILTYQDKIYEIYNHKGHRPTWIKHRFDKIKTIFNYATKSRNVEYIDDLKRILDYCKKFQYPNKAKMNPNPIDKKDYIKILNVANTKQKAIILLAANSALYPQDCCDIKKSHINIKKQTLIMDRGKTGVPRVAILWDRTVKAINNLNKENPNNYDYLFVTYAGRQYSAHSIGGIWRRLRKKAGVDHAVKFEHIRDAAQTAAAEAECTVDEIRFLMGHRVKDVTDNYLKRRPKLTKKACVSIEKYFFD
ncbi:MAG: tyrosine-type recombinase/integrase [Sedimentisphaerales bacterium]|nr:tyrosine-type recombinase/integrase [Sedimentisphaerales bacterium]